MYEEGEDDNDEDMDGDDNVDNNTEYYFAEADVCKPRNFFPLNTLDGDVWIFRVATFKLRNVSGVTCTYNFFHNNFIKFKRKMRRRQIIPNITQKGGISTGHIVRQHLLQYGVTKHKKSKRSCDSHSSEKLEEKSCLC